MTHEHAQNVQATAIRMSHRRMTRQHSRENWPGRETPRTPAGAGAHSPDAMPADRAEFPRSPVPKQEG